MYVDRDSPAKVAARWQDRLGDAAWVRTRDEAIDEGWFGPVDDDVRERYGHVLVAMRDDWAVMTRRFPRELTLVGMHGSLTPTRCSSRCSRTRGTSSMHRGPASLESQGPHASVVSHVHVGNRHLTHQITCVKYRDRGWSGAHVTRSVGDRHLAQDIPGWGVT